jgi:hypothetical protein
MVKKTVLYAWAWQVLNIYKFPEEKEIVEKAIFIKNVFRH